MAVKPDEQQLQVEGSIQEPVKAAAQHLERLLRAPLAPGLYLVATPIGNLGDLSLRAIATLARCDVIYCEDTRRSRILVDQFGIDRPLRAYHDHNAERERPAILATLGRGGRVALISDAGTPLVSDPGYKLVRDVVAEGNGVFAIPGASAVLTALSVAALPTDSFFFAGFLPPKSGARRSRLQALAHIPGTLVFFETALRLPEVLADAADVLGSDRHAAVARELTKLHEEVLRGTLGDLRARGLDLVGEIVVLVAPPPERETSDETVLARLDALLASLSLKDAARAVADEFGIPKARAYDLALELKRGRS